MQYVHRPHDNDTNIVKGTPKVGDIIWYQQQYSEDVKMGEVVDIPERNGLKWRFFIQHYDGTESRVSWHQRLTWGKINERLFTSIRDDYQSTFEGIVGLVMHKKPIYFDPDKIPEWVLKLQKISTCTDYVTDTDPSYGSEPFWRIDVVYTYGTDFYLVSMAYQDEPMLCGVTKTYYDALKMIENDEYREKIMEYEQRLCNPIEEDSV